MLSQYEGNPAESAVSLGGTTWTLTVTWSDGTKTVITNIMNHSEPDEKGILKVTGEEDGNAGLHNINTNKARKWSWTLVS